MLKTVSVTPKSTGTTARTRRASQVVTSREIDRDGRMAPDARSR
jgi:hypothetical protein